MADSSNAAAGSPPVPPPTAADAAPVAPAEDAPAAPATAAATAAEIKYKGLMTPEGELSKKKQKRLARMGGWEGISAHWEKKKQEYKQRVKDRKKAAREARETEWAALTEEEREARKEEAVELWAGRKAEKERLEAFMAESVANPLCRPQIVIDCDFEDKMLDKGIKSTAQQICLAHSLLRRHGFACRLSLCGLKPEAEGGKLIRSLQLKQNFKNWDMKVSAEPVSAIQAENPGAECVYLTGDSPNTLTALKPGSFYFVGGIVDRNTHKGLTLQKATDLGLSHAKFPLDEFLSKRENAEYVCKTLTTNHVVAVLNSFALQGNWDTAFEVVLPTRREKVVKKRAAGSKDEHGSDADGADAGADSADAADADADADADASADAVSAERGVPEAKKQRVE